MIDRPINYTGPMVRARNEGRKRMTRRVASFFCGREAEVAMQFAPRFEDGVWKAAYAGFECACPYGVPGDRLWVREAHAITDFRITDFRTVGSFRPLYEVTGRYNADEAPFQIVLTAAESVLFHARQRKLGGVPGRFMYRSLSRGLDEVVSVCVERVQEISEADAKDEGVGVWLESNPRPARDGNPDEYRAGFRELWDSINAKRGHGWEVNDWVWVVEFRPADGLGGQSGLSGRDGRAGGAR